MRPTLLLTHVARALSGPGAPCAGQTVVAGLSGGADSVALADALAAVGRARGFRVVAAHLDHGLRPSARDDAAFCRELCGRLGVPLRAGTADVAARAERDGGGIEEAAREERYAFLRRVAQEEGAVAIAVAHTRDDQAETLLLRLLRGAGRRGLAWREDPTNADPSFLRNRVRAELLPYLESRFNPSARETLARAAVVLADEDDLLAGLADELWAQAARSEAPAVWIEREALRRAPRPLARRVLRRALGETGGLRGIGQGHVEKLLGLAGAVSGRRLPLPGGREASVRFGDLWIGPRAMPAGPFAFDLPVPGRVELPGGQALLARPARGPATAEALSAVVAAPEGPLVVRTRRAGDRVRTDQKETSLKRFLVDRRVPADLRPGLPLVAAGNLVLWVPGLEGAGGLGGAPRFVHLQLQGAVQ